MIEVDGSHGVGGGQLVRMAAALAAITGKATRISNVRAGRPKPGLAAQHVAAIRAVAAIANADVSGASVGSREVTLKPGVLRGGQFRFDVGTAGSVTLVLQACLPVALLTPDPVDLVITGGTDVPWSPPADYFRSVFLPLLARMGARVEMEIVRRGYYPRGGGEVRVRVTPCATFRPLVVEPPGPLVRIRGVAHASNLPEHVPRRMKESAAKALVGLGAMEIEEVRLDSEAALGPGGAIVLWAERGNTVLGSSALARRGVPSEKLGLVAADEMVRDEQAGVSLDVHASDQVLIYAALGNGESRFSAREFSSHAGTTMWLLQLFRNAKFEMREERRFVSFSVDNR